MTSNRLQLFVLLCCLLMAMPVLAAKAKTKKGKTKAAPAAAQAVPPPADSTATSEAAATATPKAEPASQEGSVETKAPATVVAPSASPNPAVAAEQGQAPQEIRATEVASEPKPMPEPAAAPPTVRGDDTTLGLSAGLKVGALVPTSAMGATYSIGMCADYRLPILERLLGIGLSLAFARPSKSGSLSGAASDAPVDYTVREQMILVALEMSAQKSWGELGLFGGAGMGLYFIGSTSELAGMTNRERQKRLGPALFGGASYALGPGAITAELRYHYVGLAFVATGDSNAGGVTTAVGYRVSF